jgi:metal-responsive CopG/Arc/MetJ family transcriptional regulator
MTRILADLPEDDLQKLDAVAAREKCSRAAVLRDAVRLYLVNKSDPKDWIERGFGYWANRTDIGDGVEYQQAMREDRTPYDEL